MLPLNLLLLALPLLTAAAPAPAIPWLSSNRATAAPVPAVPGPVSAPPPPAGPAKNSQNKNDVFRVSEGNSVALFNGIPVDIATGCPLKVTNINDNPASPSLHKRALKKKLGLDFLDDPNTDDAAVQVLLRSSDVGRLDFASSPPPPAMQQYPPPYPPSYPQAAPMPYPQYHPIPIQHQPSPPAAAPAAAAAEKEESAEELIAGAKEMDWAGNSYMVYNGVPLRVKGASPTRKALALTANDKLVKRQDNDSGDRDGAPYFGTDGADDRKRKLAKRQVPGGGYGYGTDGAGDDEEVLLRRQAPGQYGYGTDGADDEEDVVTVAKRQTPGGYGYGTDGTNDDEEGTLAKRDANVHDKLGLGMFDIPSVGGRKKSVSAPAPAPIPEPEPTVVVVPEVITPPAASPLPVPEDTEEEISLDDLANGKSFVIYNGIPVEMNGKTVRNKSLKKPRPAFRGGRLQKRGAGKKITGFNPFAPNPVTRNSQTSGDTNSAGVERSSVLRSPNSENSETVNVSKGNDYVLFNGRPVVNGMGPF